MMVHACKFKYVCVEWSVCVCLWGRRGLLKCPVREEGCLQPLLWRLFIVPENKTKRGEEEVKEREKRQKKKEHKGAEEMWFGGGRDRKRQGGGGEAKS